MAMVFGEALGVDTNKLIRMALVHDIAEGVKGDIVVERGNQIDEQARQRKDAKEIEALRQIFSGVTAVDEIIDLQSHETSQEAQVLKQLERLEMAVQALEYEEEFEKDLSEFFDNAEQHITHPYLKEILQTVTAQRAER